MIASFRNSIGRLRSAFQFPPFASQSLDSNSRFGLCFCGMVDFLDRSGRKPWTLSWDHYPAHQTHTPILTPTQVRPRFLQTLVPKLDLSSLGASILAFSHFCD